MPVIHMECLRLDRKVNSPLQAQETRMAILSRPLDQYREPWADSRRKDEGTRVYHQVQDSTVETITLHPCEEDMDHQEEEEDILHEAPMDREVGMEDRKDRQVLVEEADMVHEVVIMVAEEAGLQWTV
jgi:SpoVK/Ycf46/Vps4 family AAA+-type ATPase